MLKQKHLRERYKWSMPLTFEFQTKAHKIQYAAIDQAICKGEHPEKCIRL